MHVGVSSHPLVYYLERTLEESWNRFFTVRFAVNFFSGKHALPSLPVNENDRNDRPPIGSTGK
jgi:hypothetical protein